MAKDKKEENTAAEPKKESPIPIDSDALPNWQKQMWQEYTDDYSKQISEVCYNESFKVLYNAVEAKNNEDLLFAEPKWIASELVKKNMTTMQVEHVDSMKSNWIQLTRQAAMTPEEYQKNKISIPINYSELANERKLAEKQYYEEAARIIFKLKINGETRELSIEDYNRLERTNLKFAVDAVQLSLAKPEPKKAEISPSLYT